MILDTKKPNELEKLHEMVDKYVQNGEVVEFSKKIKSKSVDQCSYCHVLIKLWAIEFGWNEEEAKTNEQRGEVGGAGPGVVGPSPNSIESKPETRWV